MKTELQRELMRKAIGHIQAGTTDMAHGVYRQPAANYVDPHRGADEHRLFFQSASEPLMIALSCTMPNAGDFVADDMTGVPLIAVRGSDGVARVFRNACQHRGARLASGTGNVRSFTCPYHGWTYALDGELKGIPDKRSFPDVCPSEHHLVQLPTVERHGMIWAVPGAPAQASTSIDLAGFLQGLDGELGSYGIENFHPYEKRTLTSRMNWKLVMDTFLEPYHFGILHRNTVARIFVHNLSLFEGFGPHLRELFPRSTIVSENVTVDDEPDALRHNSIIYLLFPNTVIISQVDHLEIWRIFPREGSVHETVMQLTFLIPEPITSDKARGHWERSMDLTVRTVLNEDFATAEGIHANYANGSVSHATIGMCEPALSHFERTVNTELERRKTSAGMPQPRHAAMTGA
jgi:nitrite reductase/ring-hydroxylating ferredoxin subunit